MPTPVDSYLVGKVMVNCKGGGYEHVYPMLAGDFATAEIDLRMIIVSLSILLEKNSSVAYAELSSVGGIADGYMISHGDVFYNQPLSQTAPLVSEAARADIGGAADPGQGIMWQLDAGPRQVKRLLRSIRSTWYVNGTLLQAVSAPSNRGAAITLAGGGNSIGYLLYGVGVTSAADALSNYFSIVRDKTAWYTKNPGAPPKYLQYPFLAAGGVAGLPDWKVLGEGYKKVGFGWPPEKGRKPNYA